jgi:serine/threonine-protein kinase
VDRIDPQAATLLESESSGPPATESSRDLGATRAVLSGRYEILALLGAGGMGAVYKAHDAHLDEIVALKLLRRDLAEVPGMLERFRQEVRLARRVTSPHVARTFDIGQHDHDHFLTMELVDGESLASLVSRTGPLPEAEVLRIATAVARGLAAAHAAGVVHRDLKPENVLLGGGGAVKVTDFGIAKARGLTSAGEGPIGTPAYMAPEQVTADERVDERADVYAFGAVLYEMLTGEPAWSGATTLAVAAARLVRPPPDPRARRPGASPALAELALACLARSPDARPKNLLEELERVVVEPRRAPSTDPGADVGLRDPVVKRVAVAPLVNEGDPADAHVAGGLTEEIADGLAMSRGLRVLSGLAPGARDVVASGASLGAHVVVGGRVRRTGDRVRLSLRAVSVADGVLVWAQRFERPIAELFDLVESVVAALAEALDVEARALPRAPVDPAILDLVLRARQAYAAYGHRGISEARALLARAVALAPDEPLVLATKAGVLLRRLSVGGSDPGDFAEAIRAAERAAALAPHLCEAQLGLAFANMHRARPVEMAASARRALAASPSSAEARLLVGRIHLDAMRFQEGIDQLRVALDIDPRLMIARIDLVRAYALSGDWERAREIATSTEDDTWGYWVSVVRIFGVWRRDELLDRLRERVGEVVASAEWLAPIELQGQYDDVAAGRFTQERIEGIRAVLCAPHNTPHNQVFGRQLVVETLAGAGRFDEAMAALEPLSAMGLSDLAWLERCPVLEPLRGDARYGAVRDAVAAAAEAALTTLRR